MIKARPSSLVAVGFVCLALSLGVGTTEAGKPEKPGKPPKPETVEYQWQAMIVEDEYESSTLTGTGPMSIWEVYGVNYSGQIYTDGDLARIWANQMNGRYMVLGFHVEPFNTFALNGLQVTVSEGDFDGFDCSRLPCGFQEVEECDYESATQCVAEFLNGSHPASSDYHDVGFAFHSPPSCEFDLDQQPRFSSVRMSFSLWLDALDDQCGYYDYGVHGFNNPNLDCACEEIYVGTPEGAPVTLTRLDEDVWLLAVNGIGVSNLYATDCELVPINKKRNRVVAIRPMDNVEVDEFNFEILFRRVKVN